MEATFATISYPQHQPRSNKNIINDENDHIKYNELYAVSAYASMFFPLFAGYLIDRIGLAASFIICSCAMVTGQTIFMISFFYTKIILCHT